MDRTGIEPVDGTVQEKPRGNQPPGPLAGRLSDDLAPSQPTKVQRVCRLGERIKDVVHEQRLRIWPTASTECSVRTQVLVDDGNLHGVMRVVVDGLTASADRFLDGWRSGVAVCFDQRNKVIALDALPVATVVEHSPERRGVCATTLQVAHTAAQDDSNVPEVIPRTGHARPLRGSPTVEARVGSGGGIMPDVQGELRDRLSRVIDGELTLAEFQDWFVPATWDKSQIFLPTARLIQETELVISEHTSNAWDWDATRGLLGEVLGRIVERAPTVSGTDSLTMSANQIRGQSDAVDTQFVGESA